MLLEAMLAALPIAATRVSAVPEVVDDGRTGILVEPGDGAALTAAVTGLLDDPAPGALLGEAGLRRAHDRFSVARMADRTAALYSEHLNRCAASSTARCSSVGGTRAALRVRRPAASARSSCLTTAGTSRTTTRRSTTTSRAGWPTAGCTRRSPRSATTSSSSRSPRRRRSCSRRSRRSRSSRRCSRSRRRGSCTARVSARRAARRDVRRRAVGAVAAVSPALPPDLGQPGRRVARAEDPDRLPGRAARDPRGRDRGRVPRRPRARARAAAGAAAGYATLVKAPNLALVAGVVAALSPGATCAAPPSPPVPPRSSFLPQLVVNQRLFGGVLSFGYQPVCRTQLPGAAASAEGGHVVAADHPARLREADLSNATGPLVLLRGGGRPRVRVAPSSGAALARRAARGALRHRTRRVPLLDRRCNSCGIATPMSRCSRSPRGPRSSAPSGEPARPLQPVLAPVLGVLLAGSSRSPSGWPWHRRIRHRAQALRPTATVSNGAVTLRWQPPSTLGELTYTSGAAARWTRRRSARSAASTGRPRRRTTPSRPATPREGDRPPPGTWWYRVDVDARHDSDAWPPSVPLATSPPVRVGRAGALAPAGDGPDREPDRQPQPVEMLQHRDAAVEGEERACRQLLADSTRADTNQPSAPTGLTCRTSTGSNPTFASSSRSGPGRSDARARRCGRACRTARGARERAAGAALRP